MKIVKPEIKQKVAKEIKDRVSSETIPDGWKKVRNVAGIVMTTCGLITMAPISLPAGVVTWISYVGLVSGVISGRSQLAKKK